MVNQQPDDAFVQTVLEVYLKGPTPTLHLYFVLLFQSSNYSRSQISLIARSYYIAPEYEGLYRSVSHSPSYYCTRGAFFGEGGKVRFFVIPACLASTLIQSLFTRDLQISIDTVKPIRRPVRGHGPCDPIKPQCLPLGCKSNPRTIESAVSKISKAYIESANDRMRASQHFASRIVRTAAPAPIAPATIPKGILHSVSNEISVCPWVNGDRGCGP